MPRPARQRLRVCLLDPASSAIGPLLDDGFAVRVVDADRLRLTPRETVVAVLAEPVDVVLMRAAGSPFNPTTLVNLALRLKRVHPRVLIVRGGVDQAMRHLLRLLDAGLAPEAARRPTASRSAPWPARRQGGTMHAGG